MPLQVLDGFKIFKVVLIVIQQLILSPFTRFYHSRQSAIGLRLLREPINKKQQSASKFLISDF